MAMSTDTRTYGPHPDALREELREHARERAAHEREGERLRLRLRDIAERADGVLTVVEVARLAGVGRQTVYDARRGLSPT